MRRVIMGIGDSKNLLVKQLEQACCIAGIEGQEWALPSVVLNRKANCATFGKIVPEVKNHKLR